MAVPTPLNRNQIARFVGNDPDAIRAIERLFQIAGQLTPAEIATLTQLILDNSYAIGAADNKAEVALSSATAAERLADLAVFDDTKAEVAMSVAAEAKRLADMAATAPSRPEQRLDQLQDVRAFSPANGSILIYDAVQQAWLPAVGASGAFTAASGETITVVDGIITSIV
jgi:hypothetical protein